MTALAWISNYRHWKQFVRNCVNEIRKLACVENWRHCPGELNPADLPTRRVTGKDLVDNKLWFEGPEFLRDNNDQHASAKVEPEMNEAVLKELASKPPEITHSLLNKVNCENIYY